MSSTRVDREIDVMEGRVAMTSVTFTELRDQAKKYFDQVEAGDELEVYRHGKPIARVIPIRRRGSRWQTSEPLKLDSGASLSGAILQERRSED